MSSKFLIPDNWLDIYKRNKKKKCNKSNVLNSYLNSEIDNLKILSPTNKGMMSKIITDQTLSYKNNKISEINEREIVERVDAKHLSSQLIGNVEIIDEETTSSQILKMIENSDGIILINSRNQQCGYGDDWYDENDEIPKSFKNKDNIVLNPEESGETILNFTICGNCKLPKRSYREFNYVEDLGTLQKTNLVTINYLDI